MELLAVPRGDTRFGDSYLATVLAQRSGCARHEGEAALWGLLADGLVYISQGRQGTDNWRWLLTELGKRVAGGGSWEPADPDGFKRRLQRQAPDIDPRALAYLDEALRAFNARCYLSSSVMLGVAAEKVFLGLADAVVQALPSRTDKLSRAVSSPRVSQQQRFDELRKVLDADRASLPGGLVDPLTFDAVADLLRVTRNAAGHPTGTTIDEDTAHTHLAIAGGYLAKLTMLRQHFEQLAATPTASPSASDPPGGHSTTP